ncbi:MAG: DEAD/DEAH box helicase [Bacteroides sp.]|nr:DEAD/DEAH box helicase [Bacteroides sp.]
MDFKTGTLVDFRNRPWVIMQAPNPDIIILKPLGGTDAESIGLYRPLYGNGFSLKSYHFQPPTSEDLIRGWQGAAHILYDACRLSFRDVAGPFQCLGRLSFEPRPYQMVPLILALKQPSIRLLISDDVGIGKTLESLLIAKELLDRKEISRFAVVCLPHLCEQWQNEIKDKFGLDAEIIRSSTISRLEKKLQGNQNVFRDIPFQVISIDYIKADNRYKMFVEHCPELVIVDEAHTCARPRGANKGQQQRYRLLRELADKPRQQLILLTATPHSGQTEEFQSLIGLLDKKFETYQLQTAKEREELSKFFIQRRRADIKPYLGEETVFPEQVRFDDNEQYEISKSYRKVLNELINYIKSGISSARTEDKRKQRYIYWDLLALMRGVMSSPAAGISMLENKIKNEQEAEADEPLAEDSIYKFNDGLKDLLNGDDTVPNAYQKASRGEKSRLNGFIEALREIQSKDLDNKVKQVLRLVEFAVGMGKSPIVFCQYIQTAEYVGKYISEHLKSNRKTKDVVIGVITSRLADEERKIKIDELAANPRHVLVCTDCLSEGVNLQQAFDTVIHYDLPWNPNRVEQRNGRIDRFGQTAPEVLISTIYADNNPVDKIVLNVLYKKQDEIKKRLGIYLPIAENDASLMERIMKEILVLKTDNVPTLFDYDEEFIRENDRQRELEIKRVEEDQKLSRTKYAHNTEQMSPERMVVSLKEAHEVIGGVEDTERFIVNELMHSGVEVIKDAPLSYHFLEGSLPKELRTRGYFRPDPKGVIRISFASPTPKNYTYIGRNHTFVEDLSRAVVNDTINGGELAASRAMVMATDSVSTRTTVMLMRVRSVIKNKKEEYRQIVGEEMIFIGYRGNIDRHDFISTEECKKLFFEAEASENIEPAIQSAQFTKLTEWVDDENLLRVHTDDIALERANRLVESFAKYRTYINSSEYQIVEPVLPMDVIAAFVFLPSIKN